MLEKIEYIFQKNNKNIELFNLLFELFKNVKYVTNIEKGEFHIRQSSLKPKIVFKLDNIDSNIYFNIGDEKYSNLINSKISNNFRRNESSSKVNKISIHEALYKLSGHVKRIDHIGINLPTMLFSKSEWKDLIKYFSNNSNIYNYPTGETWIFLLPVTEYEYKNDISDFKILRDPKLEFVHDKYTNIIGIHIDIETNLMDSEIEELFPNIIHFEDLDFGAIYLDYRKDLNIRLDIRHNYNTTKYGEWESGKWLVNEGKRILI